MEYAPRSGRLEVPDPYYGDASGFEQVLDLSAAALARAASPPYMKVAQQPVQAAGERDRDRQREHPRHQ